MAESVELLNIDLSELNQEAEESKRTLKDLRTEIKNLRTTLEETEIGTEEFTNTLDQLSKAQSVLKQATINSNKAIEGSYDALVAEMGQLKKEWRATADVQERAAIGAKIKELNDELKSLDETIGNHQRNVGDYASAWTGLGDKVKGTSEATEGITHAFSSAIIAANAMGLETEGLSEIFMKMQLAMNFTKGLKDLEKGTKLFTKMGASIKSADKVLKLFNLDQKKGAADAVALSTAEKGVEASTKGATLAMKGLRAAIISTGIGALVVALGALIANFDKIIALFGTAKHSATEYYDAVEMLNGAIESNNDLMQLELQLMEAQGASYDELQKKEYEHLATNSDLAQSAVEAKRAEIELLKTRTRWSKQAKEQLKEYEEELKGLEEELWKANEAVIKFTLAAPIKRQIEQEKERKKEVEKSKKAYEDARKAYEKYMQTRENNAKKLLSTIREAETSMMNDYDAERSRIFDWYKDEYDNLKVMEKTEKDQLKASYKARLISAKEYQAQLTDIENQYTASRLSLIQLRRTKELELEKKTADQKDQRIKASFDKQVEEAQAAFDKQTAMADAFYNSQMADLDRLAGLAAATGDELLSGQISIKMQELTEQFIKDQGKRLMSFRDVIKQIGEDVSGASVEMTQEIASTVTEIVENATAEIQSLYNDGVAVSTDIAISKIESMKNSLVGMSDQMKETISNIISVGDGLSSQWTKVFDQLSAGIEEVTNQLNNGKKGWQSYATMAVSAVNVASSIMTALADEQDKETKEGFEQQKKFQIAATTMNMLGGIVSAWTSAMNPANAFMSVWGQIAAGAAMWLTHRRIA